MTSGRKKQDKRSRTVKKENLCLNQIYQPRSLQRSNLKFMLHQLRRNQKSKLHQRSRRMVQLNQLQNSRRNQQPLHQRHQVLRKEMMILRRFILTIRPRLSRKLVELREQEMKLLPLIKLSHHQSLKTPMRRNLNQLWSRRLNQLLWRKLNQFQ